MNTTAAAAYTPLESLLLFQSLASYGTDPDAFVRISDLLTKNVLVRDDQAYDSTRLSPDALRELYSKLLQDEWKGDGAEGDSNGDATSSKKRKLQSPPIPTIKDANDDQLPQVVDRLYGRYRDYIIRLIHEDEEKCETLTREIEEIDRGDWDEKILKEDSARANSTVSAEESKPKKGSSKSPKDGPAKPAGKQGTSALPGPTKEGLRQTKIQFPPTAAIPEDAPPSTHPHSTVLTASQPEGLANVDVLNNQSIPPKSPQVSEPAQNLPNGSQVAPPPPGHQRTPSADRLHAPSPIQPAQQRPPDKWIQYQGGPSQPPTYPSNAPNYQQFSPSQYPPQYAYPPPQRGSFSGPPSHGPPLPHGRVPSSPLNPAHPNPVVPPPNVARGPGSPAAPHLDQLANAAEQQYRASSGSPMMQQGPMPGAPYGHAYAGYPPPAAQYRDVRPPSGNGAPTQWTSQPPQHYPPPPNYGYPPPAPPGQRPFVPGPEILQPPSRPYNSPYNPSQGARPIQPSSGSTTPRPRASRDSGIQPHTPASFDRVLRTGRGTAWTPTASPSTPRVPVSSQHLEQAPTYEALSPELGPSKASGKGSARKNETSTTKRGARGGRGTQRGRAGGGASSALGSSHRSPSASSRPDELSLEKEVSSRKVKQESSTPRPIDEAGDTTADEGPSRRRGTIPDLLPLKLKRKRQQSEELITRSSGPPTHVHWTRNFPKISASALERIGAHRNASTFALPIKERDAPGYKGLILRPQDLKSIRSSIVAGSKAGAAVAATMEDQGAATVTLPISAELVPPKGIVNNAQLEKELMLMFANAIMFNPDPSRGVGKAFESLKSVEDGAVDAASKYGFDENGIVKDTRAMFADVEKIMGDLRSAEVRSGDRVAASEVEGEGDETDELGGGGEAEHGGSLAKRRRRA